MLKSNKKDLFDFELLKRLLILSNQINEKTQKEQILTKFDLWITNNRDFRIASSNLTEEKRKEFNIFVNKKLNEITKDQLFMFSSIKFYLNEFINLNNIEVKENEQLKNSNEKSLLEQSREIYEKDKQSKEKKQLTPVKFSDFMNLTENKKYYVKNMFASGTINMIFSPPKQMKSFVSYYLALCIAQGKPFLNQKTKKVNVCYFDWENPISDVQNRISGICNGMNYNYEDLNGFFLFPKQPTLIKVDKYDSFVYDELREQLLDFINKNEIKIIFFDTFRRLGNFDENDSQTINTIKSELFDPLIKETNVCIIFLHHTSKEGKTYRGSVDIEGILDTSFKITKKDKDGEIKISLICDARRNNEIDKITSNIEIENEELYDKDGDMYEKITSVKFIRTTDDIEDNDRDYSAYRNYLINYLSVGFEYRNKDLKEILKDKFDIKSDKTINEIISWCVYTVNPKVLLKNGKSKFTRYQLNPELKESVVMTNFIDENIVIDEIEKYLKLKLKNIDQLKLSELIKDDKKGWNGQFSEKNMAIIINKWNKLGWINSTKKDYLIITNLFKEENGYK